VHKTVETCGRCDGKKEVPQIASELQQNLLSTGQQPPENLNLQESVQAIIDILSQEGVLFIE